jgi:hypothetical protein
MRDRSLVLLLVAVLAFIGGKSLPTNLVPEPAAPSDRPSLTALTGETKAESPASPEAGTGEVELRQLLEAYYTASAQEEAISLPARLDLQYLIATLPDPFDSSSGYRFDSLLDAIQRAVEASHAYGYVLDRYWFPWKSGAKAPGPAAPATTGKATPDDQRRPEMPAPRKHQYLPGVLVFRKVRSETDPNGVPPSLLVVFLVGETATRGIHKKSFTVCLECMEQYPASGGDPVRILGPTFSGSQTSLEIAIREWQMGCLRRSISKSLAHLRLAARSLARPFLSSGPRYLWKSVIESLVQLRSAIRSLGRPFLTLRPFQPSLFRFRVISGSATAFEKQHFEEAFFPGTVTFQATVNHERALRMAVLRFLCARANHPLDEGRVQVAVLGESNTGFGAGVRKQTEERKYQESNANCAGEQQIENLTRIYFAFPLHISDIRNAYTKAGNGKANNIAPLPSFASRLRIPGDEGMTPDDTEPSLIPQMTAATSERLLAQMLTTIARERIKYVFILATELKDKLFLAALIRDYCPDVQLVLTGSDLMLTHPDYRYALQGAIVVSSYPLYPKNDFWSFPAKSQQGQHRQQERLIVPSEMEVGVYNAAVALLARPDHPDDYEKLTAYGAPFQSEPAYRPPVWISILGQDGPHPLHCELLDQKDKRSSPFIDYVFPVTLGETENAGHFEPQYTGFWVWPVIIFVILGGVISFPLYRRLRAPVWTQERLLLILCVAALAVVSGYVAIIVDIPLVIAPVGYRFPCFPSYSYIMPGLSTALALWLVGRLAGPSFWSMAKTHPIQGVAGVVLVLVIGWALLSGLQAALAEPSTRLDLLLFSERASDLTGGVSPVLPVFFLGMALLVVGYNQLRRWELVRDAWGFRSSPPLGPFPRTRQTPLPEIRRHHRGVWEALIEPYRRLLLKNWYWLVVLVILLFAFCRVYASFIPTAEGPVYDRLILLAFALSTLLLAYVFGQAWLLWDNLDKLLREIGKLPLWNAFQRLPKAVAHLFGPYLSSPALGPNRESHRDFRRKQLRLLALHYPSIRGELKDVLGCSDRSLMFLDQVFRYSPGPAQAAIRQAAYRKWKDAETPPGQDLHFWLEAESKWVQDWVNRHPDLNADPRQRSAEIDRLLGKAARACLLVLTRSCWNQLSVRGAYPDSPAADKPAAEEPGIDPYLARSGDLGYPLAEGRLQALQDWIHLAEDFVGIEVMAYLSQFFVHLRFLVHSLTWPPVLAVLAIVSYPFHPQRILLLVSGLFILGLAVGGIRVFVHIERNEVISRILKTPPNQLSFNWEFVRSIGLAIVPLLSVLAVASSEMSDLLHTLLDPLYRVFK